jgi:hypothetical protein
METKSQGTGPEMEPGDGDNPERDFTVDEESSAGDIEREWLGDHPELAADESRISTFTRDPKRESKREAGSGRSRGTGRPSDWSAVLGRLGGSSPGSEENLRLAEQFAAVRFPATREEALRSLPPDAEFRFKSAVVDLREAIQDSHIQAFKNAYDLIDAVKDEFRRAEKREAAA